MAPRGAPSALVSWIVMLGVGGSSWGTSTDTEAPGAPVTASCSREDRQHTATRLLSQGRGEAAIEMLVNCVDEASPASMERSALLHDLAAVQLKQGHSAEAVASMGAAVAIADANSGASAEQQIDLLGEALTIAGKAKFFVDAINFGEKLAELRLGLAVGTWRQSRAVSAITEAAETQSKSPKPKDSEHWQKLTLAYLKHGGAVERELANVTFSLALIADPVGAHELRPKFTDFLQSKGEFATAVRVQADDLAEQAAVWRAEQSGKARRNAHRDIPLVTAGDRAVAARHGWLFFGFQLDTQVHNVGRALLDFHIGNSSWAGYIDPYVKGCQIDRTAVEWKWLLSGPSDVYSTTNLTRLASQCVRHQNVLAQLLDAGADPHVLNGFGYAPIHYAALLGDTPLLREMLQLYTTKGNNYDSVLALTTSLGHQPLHLAVMRGHLDAIRLLVDLHREHGVALDAQDRLGNTPITIACKHRFLATAIANIIVPTQSSTSVSSTDDSDDDDIDDRIIACHAQHIMIKDAPVASTQKNYHADGWRQPLLPNTEADFSCDFDVVSNKTSADSFAENYLSLQRPVLVRAAVIGKSKKLRKLQKRWSRSTLVHRRGKQIVEVSNIPYADAFGANLSEMKLESYLKYLDARAAFAVNGTESHDDTLDPTGPPAYVFQALDSKAAMIKDMFMPSILDPKVTDIVPITHQAYLGPEGSGAPLHWHGQAYNVLMAGAKKWALVPPPFAAYSKVPAWQFFEYEVMKLKQTGVPVLQCTQLAGDLLYVPIGWAHATLNLAESVGYASEFVWGASEFSLDPESYGPDPHAENWHDEF